jgi:hypothetical protein
MFEPGVDEASVKQLIALGYPRAMAEQALASCSGNLGQATSMLKNQVEKGSKEKKRKKKRKNASFF